MVPEQRKRMDVVVGLWWVLTKALCVHFCCELQDVQGMEYIGCYRDGWDRDFSGSHEANIRHNTPEACVNSCLAKNSLFAAVQHGDECFCGNSYGRYGQLSELECNHRCTGDRKQICGGSWVNSVYATGKQLICDYTMPCSSDNDLRKDCPVKGAAKIVNVTVKSHTCGRRRGTWNLDDICGFHGVTLWVKYGCYIWFSVCYIPINAGTTVTANETNRTVSTFRESTASLTTTTTPSETPITVAVINVFTSGITTDFTSGITTDITSDIRTDITSGITTDTVENNSVPGKYNMAASENKGSSGVPIPAIVVPVAVIACVGLSVVLIVILRRRYLNSKSASPKPVSTPQRDNDVEDGSQNNAYESLQDRLAQEPSYSTIERSDVVDVTPMLSIPLSHPNNTLMTMNGIVIGEYVQPEREYINDSPDLEAYANVGSANRLSDDN